MITNDKSGGLIGAMGTAVRNTPSKDNAALSLVLIAGVLTILKKAGVNIPDYAMWFSATLGIAALLYEMIYSGDTVRAWYNAKAGKMLSSAVIWAFAFTYAVNNWLGAASENQAEKSNMHKAAFVASQSVEMRQKIAEKEVARIQERLGWMDTAVNGRPVRTAEAAQADIDNAKSHRFWKVTNECTETKGPQTRQFCSDYRLATSEVGYAMEKMQLAEELKVARADLEKVTAEAKGTKVEVSEGRSDLLLLTKWGGLSEEDAAALNGLWAIVAVSIFLSFGSARKALLEEQEKGPRKHFNWAFKAYRFVYRLLNGGDLPTVYTSHTVVEKNTGRQITLGQAAGIAVPA